MSYISDIIKDVKAVQRDLPEIGKEAVKLNEDYIIKYFQDNQIGQGLKAGSTGALVEARKLATRQRGYGKTTQSWWRESIHYQSWMDKSQGNPFYFQWTGEFFGKMFVYSSGKYEFGISSYDMKTKLLTRQFGDLFKLANPTLNHVMKEAVNPTINDLLNKRLSQLL